MSIFSFLPPESDTVTNNLLGFVTFRIPQQKVYIHNMKGAPNQKKYKGREKRKSLPTETLERPRRNGRST